MIEWKHKCQAWPRPKVKYSEKEATIEARSVNASRLQGYVVSFPCKTCKRWHVGTPKESSNGKI